MENNPQNIKIEVEPMFSEERYNYFRECGLTEEEIRVLERAEAASKVTELVPEDVKPVFDMIENLPENPVQAYDAINKLAETDPEAFLQMMAVTDAVDMGNEVDE